MCERLPREDFLLWKKAKEKGLIFLSFCRLKGHTHAKWKGQFAFLISRIYYCFSYLDFSSFSNGFSVLESFHIAARHMRHCIELPFFSTIFKMGTPVANVSFMLIFFKDHKGGFQFSLPVYFSCSIFSFAFIFLNT